MSDLRAPFGIDIATTLVGSGVTLVFSGLVIEFGSRVEQYTNAELYWIVGAALFAVGLLVGVLLGAARAV